jgi:uncharacterized protein YqfA (UPF0365 family)
VNRKIVSAEARQAWKAHMAFTYHRDTCHRIAGGDTCITCDALSAIADTKRIDYQFKRATEREGG